MHLKVLRYTLCVRVRLSVCAFAHVYVEAREHFFKAVQWTGGRAASTYQWLCPVVIHSCKPVSLA